jgi:hypothetical protein
MTTLELTDEEAFALGFLCRLPCTMNWQDGNDPDEQELKFRTGKISLRKKMEALTKDKTAEKPPDGAPCQTS